MTDGEENNQKNNWTISIVFILKSTPIVLKKLSLKEFSYKKLNDQS